MARLKKRKNAGVGIDFRRAKRKVGRVLPRAANRTDTTIRARSIHVPGQSVAADRQGAALSKRQLSLKELLQQTKHYSSKVKREAWTGLAELFGEFPSELTTHLNHVVQAVSEAMVDSDAGVRQSCHKHMAKVVLPTVSTDALRPFVPNLMSHICCALTGLDRALRRDGLKFLQLMVEYCGGLMGGVHLEACLQQFVHLLGNTRQFRKLESQSQASLEQVLCVFNDLLSGVSPLHSDHSSSDFQPHGTPLFSLQGVVGESRNDVTAHLTALLKSIRSVFEASLLLMETAEDDAAMHIVVASVTSHLLITEWLPVENQSEIQSNLKGVCSKLEGRFPWATEVTDSSDKRKLVGAFNLKAAHLLVLFMNISHDTHPCLFHQGLLQFYSGMMDEALNDVTAPNCEAVTLLLPQIELLLMALDKEEQQHIMSKLIMCCEVFSKKPRSQLLCLQFLFERLNEQFFPSQRSTTGKTPLSLFVWSESDLVGSDVESTDGRDRWVPAEICLQILHLLVRTTDASLAESLTKRLPEFLLLMVVRMRDPKTGKEGLSDSMQWLNDDDSFLNEMITANEEVICCLGKLKRQPGPLMKCPLETQLLFLDCLFYMPTSGQPLMDLTSLLFISRETSFSTEFLSKLFFLFAHRLSEARLTEETVTALKTLVRTLLSDVTEQGRHQGRHEVLGSAVIHLVLRLIPGPDHFAMELVEVNLKSAGVSYGVLRLGFHVLTGVQHRMKTENRQCFEELLSQLLSTYVFQHLEKKNHSSSLEAAGTEAIEWGPLKLICSRHTPLLPYVLNCIKGHMDSCDPEAYHQAAQLLVALLETRDLSNQWIELRDQVLDLKTVLEERLDSEMAISYRLSALAQHLLS